MDFFAGGLRSSQSVYRHEGTVRLPLGKSVLIFARLFEPEDAETQDATISLL